MVTLREFVQAFRELRLNPSQPVLGHVELPPIDDILGALPSRASGVTAPAFMYPAMIIGVSPQGSSFKWRAARGAID